MIDGMSPRAIILRRGGMRSKKAVLPNHLIECFWAKALGERLVAIVLLGGVLKEIACSSSVAPTNGRR